MAFDSLLVLRDGSVDLEQATAGSFADTTSTTRTGGSGQVCIDLKKTGTKGLAAVLIMPAEIAGGTKTLDVKIQECATVDGTYVDLVIFPQMTDANTPQVSIRRFATDKRFVRGKYVPGSTATCGAVQLLIGNEEWVRL